MKKISRTKSGFTLIEVIVALTIFIVGIVILFPLFSGSLGLLSDAQMRIHAADVGRFMMTKIEARGFESDMSDTPLTACEAPYDKFQYEIKWTAMLDDIAAPGKNVLSKADLTIYWHGRSGMNREKFVTYVARMKS
jgi:prepilin-type N-terminal cleavage/methylation domain-containing protein